MIKRFKQFFPLYFIPIPVFFTSSGIYKGSSIGGDNTLALPISLLVIIIAFFFNRKYFSVLFDKKNIFLIFILLYSVLIFLLKIIFSGSEINPNLLLISTIPLLTSFSIGYALKPLLLRDNLAKVMNSVVFTFSMLCLTHLLASVASFGVVGAFANRGEDSVFGFFSIYQKFVYYPTMTSCFFVLSLFSTLKRKYIYSVVFLLVILMTGAREAILISIFGILCSFFLNSNKSFSYYLKVLSVLFVGILLIIYFLDPIKEILESASFLIKLQNLIESNDVTAGRFTATQTVFKNSSDSFNIFIGTGYSMNLGDFRSPHNQYAEILLRSGVLGLGLFTIFIIQVLRKMLLNIRQYRNSIIISPIYGFVIVYLCLLIVSFNVNVPIRAPYTATLFGFISGFFYNIKPSIHEMR